jgi:hypothetical protein
MPKHRRVSEVCDHGARRLLRRTVLSCFALALAAALPARAGDAPGLLVIAHPLRPETSVERAFVADLFLKNVTHWRNNDAARPVDQRLDADVRRRFSESVLRRSVAAVKTYWQQRIFSGRGVPPPELESDEAVVSYVEAHPGSIGYISAAAPHGRTKVLTVTP